MPFELSEYSETVGGASGIGELMADLGEAFSTRPDILMLGGGNPAAVPGAQAIWRSRMAELLEEREEFDRMLVNYDGPAGSPRFLEAVAGCLRRAFGWELGPENVAVTAGGQTAFFHLVNLFSGRFRGGRTREIVMPLAPEYIGYANQGLSEGQFRSLRPVIGEGEGREFKYGIDFSRLELDDRAGAVIVSRPTNPSGNVLTDEEIARLAEMARAAGVPLIVDNAYGQPFPGAIFGRARPIWDEGMILTLSLSKLGLPGTRTGIVVGHPQVVEKVKSLTSVVSLANGNIGQVIVAPLLESGEILEIADGIIRPFYEGRARQASEWVREIFGDRFPWRMHKVEGAFFLWLWFPGLPVRSAELYQGLKERGVLVVPGHHFFFGLGEEEREWRHRHECIRVTFSQAPEVVEEGLRRIGDVVEEVFGKVKSGK
jgi:valine--pyruvate aminotransferase